MSEIVLDGATVLLDPRDARNFRWDWDTDNLAIGVSIASSAMRIRAIKPAALAITSITRALTIATVTTSAAHGLSSGDWVTLSGATQTDYNITAQATVTGANTFTIVVANAPSTPATGTPVYAPGLGMDQVSILSASPYNNRHTFMRLSGSGGDASLGALFEVSNTIVTDEGIAQTKDRFFRVLIANL